MSNAPIMTEAQLEAERAALRAENAAILAANRDAHRNFDALMADYKAAKAELDAANAAGEKLAGDLATVSGALDLARTELDALKARPVRVKPLVWGQVRPGIFEAKSPAGKMMIYVLADGCMLDAPGTDTDSRRRLWKFADLQAAQSFAQREFDTAMVPFLSALDLGQAQAQPAPVVPDGWTLVPTAGNWADADPGCEMAEVLCNAARVCGGGAAEIYRALLDKAPPAPLLTEAQAGAKALREAANEIHKQCNRSWPNVRAWLRAEADRLERENGK